MLFDAFRFSSTVETNLRSFAVFAVLLSLTLMVGSMVGGMAGVWIGLSLHLGLTAAVTWFSKEIILWMTDARTVKEGETPEGFDLCEMINRLRQEPHINLSVMPQVCILETEQKNAFATGRHQRHAAIAVTRGLLQAIRRGAKNPTEAKCLIEAVLLHELGHIVNQDILIRAVASILAGSICQMSQAFYEKKREKEASHPIGRFFMFYCLIPLSATLLSLCLSRTRELAADDVAAKCGHAKDLAGALSLLKDDPHRGEIRSPILDTFARMMCASTDPTEDQRIATQLKASETGFLRKCYLQYLAWNSTHPPIEERIERMKTWTP